MPLFLWLPVGPGGGVLHAFERMECADAVDYEPRCGVRGESPPAVSIGKDRKGRDICLRCLQLLSQPPRPATGR
jgi:hypothetical protein